MRADRGSPRSSSPSRRRSSRPWRRVEPKQGWNLRILHPLAREPSESARFSSDDLLNGHFEDHGSDFGATTASEYEQQASDFLTNRENPDILEFERVRGYRAADTVRFNPETDEFGVISRDGSIRTYYRPVPSLHGFATNLDYFNSEREKTGE